MTFENKFDLFGITKCQLEMLCYGSNNDECGRLRSTSACCLLYLHLKDWNSWISTQKYSKREKSQHLTQNVKIHGFREFVIFAQR